MASPIIMKFGGSSVADAARIQGVAEIIASMSAGPRVVVVSAMAGVTDTLVAITQAIKRHDASMVHDLLGDIAQLHQTTVGQFKCDPSLKHQLGGTMTQLLTELRKTVDDVMSEERFSKSNYDRIVSFGERLSIRLVAAAVHHAGVDSVPIEATELIVTSDRFSDAEPLLDESTVRTHKRLDQLLKDGQVPIVTGFIGATIDGHTTTLGRGASDYTATILGYCLNAREVWIWTDVTGVMTADPRLIPDARTIDYLSYEEAAELSYYGAKVLHPLTMVPASLKNIPIWIKNTFDPSATGTQIWSNAAFGGAVKAISVKKNLALIRVRGSGISGVPRIVSRVFNPLAEQQVDVYLISHASSEQTISFIVQESEGDKAVSLVRREFAHEILSHEIDDVHLIDKLAIVAVVGEGMQGMSGVTGQIFSSLGASGVNVVAIAYGSSERNISFAVDEADADTAIKSLHQTFKLVGKKESWLTLPKLLKRKQ